jgi:hypothetical protein
MTLQYASGEISRARWSTVGGAAAGARAPRPRGFLRLRRDCPARYGKGTSHKRIRAPAAQLALGSGISWNKPSSMARLKLLWSYGCSVRARSCSSSHASRTFLLRRPPHPTTQHRTHDRRCGDTLHANARSRRVHPCGAAASAARQVHKNQEGQQAVHPSRLRNAAVPRGSGCGRSSLRPAVNCPKRTRVAPGPDVPSEGDNARGP